MRTAPFLLHLSVSTLSFLGLTSLHAQTTWNNPATGDWSLASNWNPATVPGSATDAIVDNGGTCQVTTSGNQSNSLAIGNAGTGFLQVNSGGALTTTNQLFVGEQNGSTGSFTISGTGSSWTDTSYQVCIGYYGTGVMTIQNGGSATASETMYVGVQPGSTGSVVINGSGSNLYIGSPTSIGGQTLYIGSPSSSFQSNGIGSVTIENGGNVTIYDEDTVVGPGGTLTVTGANSTYTSGLFSEGINESAGGNIQVTAGGSLHSSGEFAGTLNIDGSSLLFANGSGGYNGTTTVQNGGSISEFQSTLGGNVAIDGASSTWTDSSDMFVESGTFTIQNQATVSPSQITLISTAALQIGNGGAAGNLNVALVVMSGSGTQLIFDHNQSAYTFSPQISQSGSIVQKGSGTTILTGNNTSFTGPVSITGGELSLGSSKAIGSASSISFFGGSLQFTSQNTTDYSTHFSTAAGQSFSFDTNGQAVTLSGNLTSSGGTLTKNGTGTLTLAGTSTYSGGTTVTAGTLQLNQGASLSSTTAVQLASGATFDLGGNSQSIAALSDLNGAGGLLTNSSSTPATLTVGSGNSNTQFSGTMTPAIGKSISLVKNGTGILTLTGSSNSLSSLIINAGELTLSSSPELNGNFSQLAGATLNLSINSTSSYSAVSTPGTATLAGALNIIGSTYASGAKAGDSFTLLSATTGLSGTFSTIGLPALSSGLFWYTGYFTNSLQAIVLSQNSLKSLSTGNPFSFTAAPTGSGPFTYQWYFNESAIAGATNATYSGIAANSGLYSVVASNAAGASIEYFDLTVAPPSSDTPTMPVWGLIILAFLLCWAGGQNLRVKNSQA